MNDRPRPRPPATQQHSAGLRRMPTATAAGPTVAPRTVEPRTTLPPAGEFQPISPGPGSVRRRWMIVLLTLLLSVGVALAGLLAARALAADGYRAAPATIQIRIPARPPLSSGVPLVTIPWGQGPGEVGISRPPQGLARGPEALAIAPDGRIAVLDSVNRRVVVLDTDGLVQATFNIPLAAARFIAAETEAIYVLDCDEDQRLVSFDWHGAIRVTQDIVPDADPATGLFAREGCAYVERAHERVTRIRAGGGEDAVDTPGRPVQDRGKPFARVRFDRGAPPRVRISAGKAAEAGPAAPSEGGSTDKAIIDLEYTPDAPLEHLVSVDGDGEDGLILGARLARPEVTPEGAAALVLVRASTSGDGTALSMRLAEGAAIAETGQPYVVGPGGRVYQARATEQGYSIFMHSFPEGDAR